MTPYEAHKLYGTRPIQSIREVKDALERVRFVPVSDGKELSGDARCPVCRINRRAKSVFDVKGSWEPAFGSVYFVLCREGYPHDPERCRRNLELFALRIKGHKTNRRAAVKAASGKISVVEWEAIVKRQRGRCFDCKRSVPLTKGHLVPLVHPKASHGAANIIAQCRSCNSTQRKKIHVEALRRGLVTKRDVQRWKGDFGDVLLYRPSRRANPGA